MLFYLCNYLFLRVRKVHRVKNEWKISDYANLTVIYCIYLFVFEVYCVYFPVHIGIKEHFVFGRQYFKVGFGRYGQKRYHDKMFHVSRYR